MVKVLFVDDEPDIELLAKQKFRKQIANGAFDILFALNGQEALDLIGRDADIAVVVSDINMPQMDGLTLLEKIKEFNPFIKTIVVSAYGDTKTIRSAMHKGVFDFVTKPIDFKELEESIEFALEEYVLSTAPLYLYQFQLAKSFPQNVELHYPYWKNTILWDVFNLNSQHAIVLGVALLPTPVSSEIVLSTAHGILKSELLQNRDLSLLTYEKQLSTISSSLKVHVLAGQYQRESQAFTYRTNGEFKVHHIVSDVKTPLVPSQSVLLTQGDSVTLKGTDSSHLSLYGV